VPPGVDEAAYVKAGFLSAIARGDTECPLISRDEAVKLLGNMHGGYNIETLVGLLADDDLGALAAEELKHTLLVFEAFHDVADLANEGNDNASAVMQSWADGEWFTRRPEVPESHQGIDFQGHGRDQYGRPLSRPGCLEPPGHPPPRAGHVQDDPRRPDSRGTRREGPAGADRGGQGEGPARGLRRRRGRHRLLAQVRHQLGAVVLRRRHPGVPNKKGGGICIGGKVAPIFYNTMEDAGALVFEAPVDDLNMGDVIEIRPYEGKILNESGDVISEFELKSDVLLDEVRAGGRINLIIGRGLTTRAREALGLPATDLFRTPEQPVDTGKGYTLAQKMVGKACGMDGVRPGTYCEPLMTTVGSQDTTGPMTRDELKDLACLGFSADLTMQSFCHTAAYPKPVDIDTQHTLPDFIMTRGGVSLRPGDGIIHSWLNRMLLPDTVGTGGDSHTRFPMGISFPAGSGLVAFAAATGVMPLDMPESVLVRFKGEMQPGITLRDLVHAIPYYAIQQGLLTVEKERQEEHLLRAHPRNRGAADLTVEQAFELSDASAERSAAGCTIDLTEDTVAEYLRSNIVLLRSMIAEGYGDARTLERRAGKMEEWLENPTLMRADKRTPSTRR
jgi:aconitate hydratase 2/2-methylisocitrate dehydratase